MLDTLKLAYQFALDRSVMHLDGTLPTTDTKRLSPAREKELGRRLARYWTMRDPTPEADIDEVIDQIAAAGTKAWAALCKGALVVKDEMERP